MTGGTCSRGHRTGGRKACQPSIGLCGLVAGRYDAQLYSDDKAHLTEQLARDVSHRSAIEPSRESAPSAQKIEPPSARGQVQEHLQQVGPSISKSTRISHSPAAVKGQARYAARP